MNLEKYNEIQVLLTMNRGIGSTHATIYGAKVNDAIIVHGTSTGAKQMMKSDCVNCISLDNLAESLRGINKPVVFDNSAVLAILHDLMCEIHRLQIINLEIPYEC